jgi:proline racemase
LTLEPGEARELCDTGELIRLAAREQLPCVRPENEQIAGVSIVQIADPRQPPDHGITQVFVDPSDPFPQGCLLSDAWPGDDLQA